MPNSLKLKRFPRSYSCTGRNSKQIYLPNPFDFFKFKNQRVGVVVEKNQKIAKKPKIFETSYYPKKPIKQNNKSLRGLNSNQGMYNQKQRRVMNRSMSKNYIQKISRNEDSILSKNENSTPLKLQNEENSLPLAFQSTSKFNKFILSKNSTTPNFYKISQNRNSRPLFNPYNPNNPTITPIKPASSHMSPYKIFKKKQFILHSEGIDTSGFQKTAISRIKTRNMKFSANIRARSQQGSRNYKNLRNRNKKQEIESSLRSSSTNKRSKNNESIHELMKTVDPLQKIKYQSTTIQGKNGQEIPINQDRTLQTKGHAIISTYHLIGVFDGDGPEGQKVSTFLKLNSKCKLQKNQYF